MTSRTRWRIVVDWTLNAEYWVPTWVGFAAVVWWRRLRRSFQFREALTGAGWSQAERDQTTQVEKYMRIWLDIMEGFESAVTIAASEPILTEAAATIAQHIQTFRSCRALRNIFVNGPDWVRETEGNSESFATLPSTLWTVSCSKTGNCKSLIVNATSYFEALNTMRRFEIRSHRHWPIKITTKHLPKFSKTLYATHFIKVYNYECRISSEMPGSSRRDCLRW